MNTRVGAKMADDTEDVINGALEDLVSVTEISGKLRKDLKERVLKAVSSIKIKYCALKLCMTKQSDQINELNKNREEMETRMQELEMMWKDSGQAGPSTDFVQRHSPATSNMLAISSGAAQKQLYSDVT